MHELHCPGPSYVACPHDGQKPHPYVQHLTTAVKVIQTARMPCCMIKCSSLCMDCSKGDKKFLGVKSSQPWPTIMPGNEQAERWPNPMGLDSSTPEKPRCTSEVPRHDMVSSQISISTTLSVRFTQAHAHAHAYQMSHPQRCADSAMQDALP